MQESKTLIDAAVITQRRTLARQHPSAWESLVNERQRAALPIVIDLASFRGSCEFSTQGFFYLSFGDLTDRLFVTSKTHAQRVIGAFIERGVLKLVRRGLSRKERAALGCKAEAAAYRIMI